MKRYIKTVAGFIGVIIIASVLLSGCNLAKNTDAAKSIMSSYFDAIKGKDYDKATTLFSDSFFEKMDKDSWKNSMENIITKSGDLMDYKLTASGTDYEAGLSGSGTYYTFTYTVEYLKATTTEKYTLYQKGSKGPILITGQSISSQELVN